MTVRQFQNLPPSGRFSSLSDVERYTRLLQDGLLKARRGKLECVVEFTLTPNTTTTVLYDERLSPQSVVSLDPKTANAATEKAAGTVYCLAANRLNSQWTFTHANNAQADRLFQLSIVG
jgi:hypothetical protein